MRLPASAGLLLLLLASCGTDELMVEPMFVCGTIESPRHGATNVPVDTTVLLGQVFETSCMPSLTFTRDDGVAVAFSQQRQASTPDLMTIVPSAPLEQDRTYTVDLGPASFCGDLKKTTFRTGPAPRVVRIDAIRTSEDRWYGSLTIVERLDVTLSEPFLSTSAGGLTVELPDGRALNAETVDGQTLHFAPGTGADAVPADANLVVKVTDALRFSSDAPYAGERAIEFRGNDGVWVPADLATGAEELCASDCASVGVSPLALVALLALRRRATRGRVPRSTGA